MNVHLIIPSELDELLSTIKHKKSRDSLIMIYQAMIYKDSKYNKYVDGNFNIFFPLPSNYIKKVRSNYQNYIKLLIDYEIIEYKSHNSGIDDGLYRKKYYNTETRVCMQYRFLIDVASGREIIVDVKTEALYTDKDWYIITKSSLKQIGLPTRIGRDSFSRRLHTPITSNTHVDEFESYKTFLRAYKGYGAVDIKECQPTLMFEYLNDKIEIDDNYIPYTIYEQINPLDRDKAKKEFATWLNCEINQMPVHINNTFPLITKYIKQYKSKNGSKSLGSKLQYMESTIVIDDLLNTIVDELGIDFCLTVHDSLIVKVEDLQLVNDWCSNKYKNLIFKQELI